MVRRIVFRVFYVLGVASAIVEEFDLGIADLTSETIVEKFGVAAGGRLHLNVAVEPTFPNGPSEQIIFSLFNKEQWDDKYQIIVAEMKQLKGLVCTSPAAMRFATRSNFSTFTFVIPKTDQYTLQLLYCKTNRAFRVKGNVVMYNLNLHSDDEGIEHLPLGEEREVQLYKVLLTIYATLTIVWLAECWRLRAVLAPLQIGCSLTLVTKLAEMSAKLVELQGLSSTGRVDKGLKTTRDVLETVSNMLFLAVLLLTSLGWTLIRDRLSRREKRLVLSVFGVYIAIGFVKSFCGSENHLCSAYLLTEYVIKSLIMLGIIVAMNFNITQLRNSLQEEQWRSSSTPSIYVKLKKFQAFRWAFLAYLLLPTVLLIIKITVLTWRYEWANKMLNELLLLVIYVHVGLTFRPRFGSVLGRIVQLIGAQHSARSTGSEVPTTEHPIMVRPRNLVLETARQNSLNAQFLQIRTTNTM